MREISANIDEINKDLKKVEESLIHKSQHSVLHTINETNNSIVIISWAVILVLVFIFIMFACSFPIVRDIGRTVAKLNRTYEIINIDQIDISNYHEISSNDYDCFVIVYQNDNNAEICSGIHSSQDILMIDTKYILDINTESKLISNCTFSDVKISNGLIDNLNNIISTPNSVLREK